METEPNQEDTTWLEGLLQRDNFLATMPSDQLRRVWDSSN
jgi:hypothetical protein